MLRLSIGSCMLRLRLKIGSCVLRLRPRTCQAAPEACMRSCIKSHDLWGTCAHLMAKQVDPSAETLVPISPDLSVFRHKLPTTSAAKL